MSSVRAYHASLSSWIVQLTHLFWCCKYNPPVIQEPSNELVTFPCLKQKKVRELKKLSRISWVNADCVLRIKFVTTWTNIDHCRPLHTVAVEIAIFLTFKPWAFLKVLVTAVLWKSGSIFLQKTITMDSKNFLAVRSKMF